MRKHDIKKEVIQFSFTMAQLPRLRSVSRRGSSSPELVLSNRLFAAAVCWSLLSASTPTAEGILNKAAFVLRLRSARGVAAIAHLCI